MYSPDNKLLLENAAPALTFGPFRRMSQFKNLINRITGDPVKTSLDDYREIAKKIRSIDLSGKSDLQLSERRSQIAHAVSTESAGRGSDSTNHSAWLSPEVELEAFALVGEASRRSLRLDPFDSQMIAGLAMARGSIAELPTGEGKPLAAVFTACCRSLSGRGVHVLTFNDYLARRDAAWMGPVYRMLGLSVGCVQEGMHPSEKRAAYACDVTYTSAKEAGFDYLRDQLAYERDSLVHRPFNFALVDEADSILIDEARIPLVISGAEDRELLNTIRLDSVVKILIPGKHFNTDDEHRNVFLTDAGIERVESLLECGSLYVAENQFLLESIYCALHARALLRRDVDYIVRDGHIQVVDEYTGRVVHNRHWPDGLQAAVEAKEGLSRRTEGRVLGSITLQHFFRLYCAIGGMTATAQSAANEFFEFYGMTVVIIPPHMASIRVDYPDVVFTHRGAKRRALLREISEKHTLGRPILVGTASVKESEELASDLKLAGIRCSVLNAKNDEHEAGIIAGAGMLGAVTISTNMAGRGIDIKLGGKEELHRDAVAALGGLYVIGTNRHESLRIDGQLRGRAGRQGDPGSTRFFISLEDDLFEHYGLTKMLKTRHRIKNQNDPLPLRSIQREIAHAQRIIEGQNFDIRRSLYRYSSLVELQRQIIQSRREELLRGLDETGSELESSYESEVSLKFSACEPLLYEEGLRCFGRDTMSELERRATLFHIDRLWSNHLAWVQDTRDSIHLVNLGGKDPLEEFRKQATETFTVMMHEITQAVVTELSAIIRTKGPVDLDMERLNGPSSTWTYLVNESPFGWGTELIKARNLGFALSAWIYTGPLFILVLLLNRVFRRKQSPLP